MDEWSSLGITCTDIHGNADGDWVFPLEDLLGQNGNICQDPLFCDPENGDFTLAEGSPCLPGVHPDCGLMGAHGVGCGAPSTVSRGQILTSGVQLGPGYPNPFNPQTTISFTLERSETARVTVFTLDGRPVRLLANRIFPAGKNTASWNGLDNRGKRLPSGSYLIMLQTDSEVRQSKVTLLK